MLIYGVLYLWFEVFPYGEYNLSNYIYLLLTDRVLVVFEGIYHFTVIQQGRKHKNLSKPVQSDLIALPSCIFRHLGRRSGIGHYIYAMAILLLPTASRKIRIPH